MRYILGFSCLFWVCLISCQSQPARRRIQAQQKQNTESAQQQARMLKAELAEIDALLAKLDKPVKRTAEGIPYYIETCGTGKPLMAHELAQFTGTIATLQGKVLYDYRNSGLQIRLLDHSWPSAMQKVLLGMKKGERRIVYLPSLYAYGLSGDRQKIGSYCSIIINFRLESFR